MALVPVLSRRPSFDKWYTTASHEAGRQPADSLLEAAYQQARQFHNCHFRREDQRTWFSEQSRMSDVIQVLQEAQNKYGAKKAGRGRLLATATSWWQATINHQELSVNVAQSLAEIGSVLPEIDFIATKLYPSELIRQTLARAETRDIHSRVIEIHKAIDKVGSLQQVFACRPDPFPGNPTMTEACPIHKERVSSYLSNIPFMPSQAIKLGSNMRDRRRGLDIQAHLSHGFLERLGAPQGTDERLRPWHSSAAQTSRTTHDFLFRAKCRPFDRNQNDHDGPHLDLLYRIWSHASNSNGTTAILKVLLIVRTTSDTFPMPAIPTQHESDLVHIVFEIPRGFQTPKTRRRADTRRSRPSRFAVASRPQDFQPFLQQFVNDKFALTL
ncbi:hypothetical protein V8F33_009780 [Rhypophila sp. PSN 637]